MNSQANLKSKWEPAIKCVVNVACEIIIRKESVMFSLGYSPLIIGFFKNKTVKSILLPVPAILALPSN
jgi:hypothetical protein